jgi:hypothetical protein
MLLRTNLEWDWFEKEAGLVNLCRNIAPSLLRILSFFYVGSLRDAWK